MRETGTIRAILILAGVLAMVAGPASAAHLILPDDKPYGSNAYSSPQIAQPWASRVPDAHVTDRPVAELIATRLGLVNGSAELFRFRVENAPSQKTMFAGEVDGGGIRFKLSW